MNSTPDFLEQMADSSRERVAAARRRCSEAALLAKALSCPLPPPLVLSPAGFDLIAELKLRSPALGQLKSGDENVAERVLLYARSGAAAVSVLTEPSRFDGSMAHLEQATQALRAVRTPVMRKDFLVDPYQVIEARVAGAGGVLVIVRMLPNSQVRALLDCARSLGLFVLLEAFDQRDIERMHDLIGVAGSADAPAPVLAGLNCRDLKSLQIVPERLHELAQLLPSNVPRVAESGVLSPADAERVAESDYQLALVGSALMQGGDPLALATAMLDAGRRRATATVEASR